MNGPFNSIKIKFKIINMFSIKKYNFVFSSETNPLIVPFCAKEEATKNKNEIKRTRKVLEKRIKDFNEDYKKSKITLSQVLNDIMIRDWYK